MTPLFRFLAYSMLVTPAIAAADEPVVPDFQNKPTQYISSHEISYVDEPTLETVNDTLLIGDVTEKDLKFYFNIYGTNGHACGGSGLALAQDGAYYYTEPSFAYRYDGKSKHWQEPALCRLRIEFDTHLASLIDEGGYCKQSRCGSRAGINQTIFIRDAHPKPPSFDCQKARTRVEQMICTDRTLSHLDGLLAKIYGKAIQVARSKIALRDSQREWLRAHRDACSDVICLEKAYYERIKKLSDKGSVW